MSQQPYVSELELGQKPKLGDYILFINRNIKILYSIAASIFAEVTTGGVDILVVNVKLVSKQPRVKLSLSACPANIKVTTLPSVSKNEFKGDNNISALTDVIFAKTSAAINALTTDLPVSAHFWLKIPSLQRIRRQSLYIQGFFSFLSFFL